MTDKTKEIALAVMKKWSDEGKIIEGGWQAFCIVSLSDAMEVQRRDMRKAYYLGAQHLWASLMNILEPGAEPTAKDEQRMQLIDDELKAFVDEIKQERTNGH